VLLAHDSDAFNRWEAGQRLALTASPRRATTTRCADAAFIEAMRGVLRDERWTRPSRNWC
jgi:aminopeptidase N